MSQSEPESVSGSRSGSHMERYDAREFHVMRGFILDWREVPSMLNGSVYDLAKRIVLPHDNVTTDRVSQAAARWHSVCASIASAQPGVYTDKEKEIAAVFQIVVNEAAKILKGVAYIDWLTDVAREWYVSEAAHNELQSITVACKLLRIEPRDVTAARVDAAAHEGLTFVQQSSVGRYPWMLADEAEEVSGALVVAATKLQQHLAALEAEGEPSPDRPRKRLRAERSPIQNPFRRGL